MIEHSIDELSERILSNRKYRHLGIPPETVHRLLMDAFNEGQNAKTAIKTAKRKLHNIIASYLGDPDYEEAIQLLDEAFEKANTEAADDSGIMDTCTHLLQSHASTRERLPYLSSFYERLFAHTGQPRTILDLACGLNPFAIRWMALPHPIQYHAYDIHLPRIHLINHYFQLEGLPPLAHLQDILLDPPAIQADVAFFFKEAHRFEKRQHGCNREMWQAIHAHYLLVSLPTESLSSGIDLRQGHRALVHQTIGAEPWKATEIEFENEMVFCIEKGS